LRMSFWFSGPNENRALAAYRPYGIWVPCRRPAFTRAGLTCYFICLCSCFWDLR